MCIRDSFWTKQSLWEMLQSWVWPLRHYSSINRAFYGFWVISPAEAVSVFQGSWLPRFAMLLILGPVVVVPVLPLVAVCSVAYWIVKRRNETSPACRYY